MVLRFTYMMDRGECGNDRPGYGVHSVTQKLSAYNIIIVLNIVKFKLYIIIIREITRFRHNLGPVAKAWHTKIAEF